MSAVLLNAASSPAKVIDDGPQKLSQISSIGESLREAGQRPLHIVYVHGIGATGAGDSHVFLKGLCRFLKGCQLPAVPVPLSRDYADHRQFALGVQPPSLSYMRKAVWQNATEWSASAPFVDHYVLHRSDGGPVVVHEINWWPLVFPLKCRGIMTADASLAGPAAAFINLCSQPEEPNPANPGRFNYYAWLSPQDAKTLEAIHPKAALINRDLKQDILDWGFSDAMMAVGSIQELFREGMRQLFVKSVRFSADGSKNDTWRREPKNSIDREYVVVSHSLGSYLIFSTLNIGQDDDPSGSESATENSAARYILERTSLVYFFANQVPLLELANIGQSLTTQIINWKKLRESFGGSHNKPPQLIAWSDPNDLLTWRIPEIEGLIVDNLYVHNTHWRWLFANPAAAHDHYAGNKSVLRVMLGRGK